MSTIASGLLQPGREEHPQEVSRKNEDQEAGLLELGAVSETRGGLIGLFLDPGGNGFTYAY